MRNNFKILIHIAAAIVVASAGAFAQNSDIGSRQWRLTHLNGRAVGQNKAYIEIDPGTGRFSGNAGCNRMFGSAKISGRNITFSGVGMTRMACMDKRATEVETGFAKALERATRYRVDGSVLSIYAGSRRIIKLKAGESSSGATEPSGTKIGNKKWVLDAIGQDPANDLGKRAFIVFDPAKGSAGGDTSCNAFGGNYSVNGQTIKFEHTMSTMRACIEDDRMTIERSFLVGLEEANRFEIKAGKLYLYKADKLLLTFRGENK